MASSSPDGVSELAPLVFITVSDSAITNIVQDIVALNEDLAEITFVHCSGNESADILEPLAQKGAQIVSMHPLQTFTSQSGPADFEGIYFSLHGDKEKFGTLENIANRLGGNTFEVSPKQKSHLHAAAVLASNYLVTLLQASTETAATSGLTDEEVKKALLPLVQTTLKNVENQTFTEALSGPIRRGDVKTVTDHLALLRDHHELRELYCSLGQQTVALARSSSHIDEETAMTFEDILQ
jgi:predicted short-subunit dehydrogenase-like oxidoreductase (DUF2520 family)